MVTNPLRSELQLEPQSYWQQGCNDARAGNASNPPRGQGRWNRERIGYEKGYKFGAELRTTEQQGYAAIAQR